MPLAMLVNTLLMALREVRRNKLRSALTTLGIVIGVAAVIALVTLGEGATARVTRDIANMGVNMLTIVPGAQRRGPSNLSAPPLTVEDARVIEREIRAVGAVAPTVSRSALAVYANKNWNTVATGTNNAYFSVRAVTLELGRSFSDVELSGGQPVCVLGATVRRELFGHQDPLGASIRLGRVSCLVIGVLTSKGQSTFGNDQDDYVLLPLSAMQRRIAGTNDLSAISVSAIDEHHTTKAKQQITALMHERRRIADGQADDFSVFDTREVQKTLETVTGVLTALLGAVAAVSLVVGGIGIMNIMLVSVTERTREIGVRLSVGARTGDILAQFLVEATALSALGGLVGIGVGLLGALGVARAVHVPFVVPASAMVLALVVSTLVGVTFGVLPARKAARLNPLAALRYE